MIPLSGFTDPPPPPEGHTLEVQRDPFLGFITHYRHKENAMKEKIGTDHIGTVSLQGTEEERKAMLRVMGAGMVGEVQEVERLLSESEAALDRLINKRVLAAHDARRKP